jgi:hypothetical protein
MPRTAVIEIAAVNFALLVRHYIKMNKYCLGGIPLQLLLQFQDRTQPPQKRKPQHYLR